MEEGRESLESAPKKHRVAEAPQTWSDLPSNRLTFCLGAREAETLLGLIRTASRCPALTAVDLRWRRHTGQQPIGEAPETKLDRVLLRNVNAPLPVWPGLQVELTETQRRSLGWMLQKEAGTDDELVVERGCHENRFSTHRGVDFQVRFSFTLLGGILADAMGYGKTLLAIALTAASCIAPLAGRSGRQPCGVTLVFTPESLVAQWLSEFQKVLGDRVEVSFAGCKESTTRQSAPNVNERTDRCNAPARVVAVPHVEGWLELMRGPWADALALVIPYSLLHAVEPWLCFHQYHWRRVVIDELHEILTSTTLADALGLVSAEHVWGLSGTLPLSTAGDVVRIANLFGVSMPVDATNAGRFLDCYVRRNEACATEVVPVDEHYVAVRPTPMERASYLACKHDFDEPISLADARGVAYTPAFLSTWRGLQEHGREAALVKLCCHHQVTEADVELLSTPDQSVERLCVWKRHHFEEAQRLVRQHVLLAEWMARGCIKPSMPDVRDGKTRQYAFKLPSPPPEQLFAESECEAWGLAAFEVERAGALDDLALISSCERDLEATPFAVCDNPVEAEARWLRWCTATGLDPGSRGAISRLRRIMYDELWGRLIDGRDGWVALGQMAGRDWRADYAAAQGGRVVEAVVDCASSLRSLRFLESVVRQACAKEAIVDCAICLQPLSNPQITPCAHLFCFECIKKSLVEKTQCPQCRAPVHGTSQLSSLGTSSGFGMFKSTLCRDICESSKPSSSTSEKSDIGDNCNIVDVEACGGRFGSKISAIVARLQAIHRAGEKAVVFAQWQDLIFKIHAALAASGILAAVLAGGALERAGILQSFEATEMHVLLLSLEDSASGTNMTHANHVLLVHPMVAASSEEQEAYEAQAVGRVRRWGQKRRVQVWRFYVEGTIEAELADRRAVGILPTVVA